MEPTAVPIIPPDALRTLNVLALVLFVMGASVGATLTAIRFFRYQLDGDEPPTLLIRDLWARGGIALPFGGVLLLRAMGVDPFREWWGPLWFLVSSGLAVAGVWVYVWYEAFIIER